MVASTSATAATDFGRELSPSERWFWIIDRISPANCVGRVRIHGELTPEQLERATAAVVAEYPLLRMGVVDTGDGHPECSPWTTRESRCTTPCPASPAAGGSTSTPR